MGQQLAARGVDTASGLWSAQALLGSPDTVDAVDREFIAAGADVITTNTYGTTRRRLDAGGDGGAFERLNRQAGELAGRARSVAEREPQYHEQAHLLADSVDRFLCETMSTASEALAAARGAR